VPEDRYCSNCRAELPRNASTCAECGVYAGEIFDGRPPGWRRRRLRLVILITILLLTAAAAVWMVRSGHDKLAFERFRPTAASEQETEPPVRVVGDRPGVTRRGEGATLSEAEAIRLLRRHLAAGRANECLVVMSRGYQDGAYAMTAFDRCENTRLGEWRADGKSGAITRGRPASP
jgi:hypothetical protein